MKTTSNIVIALLLGASTIKAQDFYSEIGIYSQYWVEGGFRISDASVMQGLLVWNVSDSDTIALWANYEEGIGTTEVDLSYRHNFSTWETGIGKFTPSLEGALWIYPEPGMPGDWEHPDLLMLPRLAWDIGKIKIEYEGRKLFTHSEGWQHQLKIERSFQVAEKLSVTPFVLTGYQDDFFGLSGSSVVQSGAKVIWSEGSWSVGGKISYQHALNEVLPDGVFGGVFMGWSFGSKIAG